MKFSKYILFLLLLHYPWKGLCAEPLKSENEKKYEIGADISLQEGTGLNLNIAYRMPVPSSFIRLGLDLGERLYEGKTGQPKQITANEYGPFFGFDMGKGDKWSLPFRVAFHYLQFPSKYSTKMSTVRTNVEFGYRADNTQFFWDISFGLSWRHKEYDRIVVGDKVLDKQLLFYPRIGSGFVF